MKKLLLVVLFLSACGPTAPDLGQFSPAVLNNGWVCADFSSSTFWNGNCEQVCPVTDPCHRVAQAWCFTSPELSRPLMQYECWTTERLCLIARDVTHAAVQDKSLCGLVP